MNEFTKLQALPAEKHNPTCNIITGNIVLDGIEYQLSYYQSIEVDTQNSWGMELYRGDNYLANGDKTNWSRNYPNFKKVPKRYIKHLIMLMQAFEKNFMVVPRGYYTIETVEELLSILKNNLPATMNETSNTLRNKGCRVSREIYDAAKLKLQGPLNPM